MTHAELQEALRLHRLWLEHDPEGVRANLSGASLCGASLYGANLREANLREANLSGADLCGANLRRANLSEVNLSEVNLRGANLSGANLSGANLSGANLSGANLREADLNGANLSGADLYGASLYGASLYGADLYGADLREANLSGANLSEADLRGAKGLPIVADAPARLRAVAAQVLSNPSCLRMSEWHSDCGTSHCLAGWAIHQAGPIGATLERLHGAHLAGLLLLGYDAAARFYQSNDEVLQWLRTINRDGEP
jgi:hypothetical protein